MTIARDSLIHCFDDDALFGMPVTLVDAVFCETDEDGEEIYTFPNADELTAAVALARVLIPVRLQAADVRGLRKACGMTATAFAKAVGMNPSTLSRIENDAQGMGDYLEKLIRIHVAETLATSAPGVAYAGARDIIAMHLTTGTGRVRVTIRRGHGAADDQHYTLGRAA